MEVISGFQTPDGGKVLFGGREVTGWTPSRRAAAGPHPDVPVGPGLEQADRDREPARRRAGTGREALWRGVLRPRATARADAGIVRDAEQTLHEVGLWAVRDQLAGELSGGQKRLLSSPGSWCPAPRWPCWTNRWRA